MRTDRSEARDIVPLAERAYPPPQGEEDSQQQTIWRNPTERTVKLEIQIETPKPGKRLNAQGQPRIMTYDEKHGTHTYYVKAGEEKALPSEYDRQIQTYQCHHIDCLHAPFDCKNFTDEGHEKTTVAGCGPQLERLGSQRVRIQPGFIQLSPALDDVAARLKAAETAEFEEWQRQRMAEARHAASASAREKAEKEIADREERKAWDAKRDAEAAAAAESVEQERAQASREKHKK